MHFPINEIPSISLPYLLLVIFVSVLGQTSAVINGNNGTGLQRPEQISGTSHQVFSSNDETDQISFQYEPSAFLLGKSDRKTHTSSNATSNSRQEHEQPRNYLLPPPATTTATSGRSGRMLDLDALMGEKSAKSTRERSHSGARQSRYLHQAQAQQQTMDFANKKLKIQGFIPIVSMKDESSEDEQEDLSNQLQNNNNNINKHQQRLLQQQQTSGQEPALGFPQSSIGHASFGVQRYLQQAQNEPPQFVNNDNLFSTNQQQQSSPSMKATVVDTLKRPLKRLASLTSSQENSKMVQGQDCLCVPFYMCKNGFVSETSVSKAQIQQMMAQQMQQNQRSPLQQQQSQQAFSIATSPEDSIQQQQSQPNADQKQVQYADSIVPVDERSMERDLISSLNFSNAFNQDGANNRTALTNPNQTNENEQQAYPSIEQLTSLTVENQNKTGQSQTDEASGANKGEDYSQEILGRMLGLRAPSRMSSSSGGTQFAGCGVLRTCCAVPAHLLGPDNNQASLKQQQLQQQQSVMQQRFQKPQQTAYGFPAASMSSAANSLIQLQQPAFAANQQQQHQLASLNVPLQMQDQLASSLAHRSTQFQVQAGNQQLQQLASQLRPQFQMQQLQPQAQQQSSLALLGSQVIGSQPPAWQQQQQQQQQKPNIINNVASMRQQLPLRSTLVGSSRKILDGRCGLRQSSGINGRVQNLQYGENSADFGEYPAQAAILKKLSGSDSLFVCGGTLISQYWIATAAHCIKKHAQQSTSELKVRLGEWDVHRDDEFYPFVEKDIRDVVIHPEFVSGNLVNDIALLRLDSPVDPTLPHVNPACLPMLDENFARQKCWVTGWGKDSFGQKGTFQSVLQEVELPVGEHNECEAALRQTRLGPHYRLHPGFICAGGEGGRDACEGDGGSGLYCVQDGIIKVAGLVSWGIGCGQAGVPGVYVNMAHYRAWIENIIAIDEDVYSPYANTLAGNLISERSSNSSLPFNDTDKSIQTSNLNNTITTTSSPNWS